MSKTLRGQYFLRNGGTQPPARRPLWESRDKFTFCFCNFHSLLKLNRSDFSEFWLFIVLITYRLY